MNIKNELLGRLYLVTAAFIIAAVVICGQAAKIQFAEGDRWRAKGDSVHLKYVAVKADRGNILSEDGLLLASSMPFFEIRFDLKPKGMSDILFNREIDSLAYHLSRIETVRSLNQEDYKNFLLRERAKGSRYLSIAKNVSYTDLQKFKKFPIFERGPNAGGFIAIKQSKRERPFGQLARRTIGYVRENAQPVGIEGYYNDVLQGKAGKQLMERINSKTYIPVTDLTLVAPKKGQDIVTTLDIDLQDVVHDALKSGLEQHAANHGSAILMDIETGAIKAISNLGKSSYGYVETYNYAVGEATEPGSTFKLATLISLLEDGAVDVDDLIDIQGGEMEFYDRKMKDSSPHGLDTVTIAKAFAISSNVGMAMIANEHYSRDAGNKKFYKNLRRMGLTEITGIEIQGEAKPIIKDPKDPDVYYSGTTIPWMAHGYELTMTPLQVLSLYAAVANDGRKMKPYIVKAFANDGEIERNFYPEIAKKRIASKSTIKKVQRLLEMVVEEGTAASHKTSRYTYAGKTGTAVTNYNVRGARSKYQASFAGYFPADNPKYACIVTVNEPTNGQFYGSSVALPIFRKIADKCFSMKTELMPYQHDLALNKPSEQFVIGSNEDLKWLTNDLKIETVSSSNAQFGVLIGKQDSVMLKERVITRNRIPNVIGMGARDAVYLLENEGLKVTMSGFGKVKNQSILAGTKPRGQNIHLKLG